MMSSSSFYGMSNALPSQDLESRSRSESTESETDTEQPMNKESTLSEELPATALVSLPILDMRRTPRFTNAKFENVNVGRYSKDSIRKEISKRYKSPLCNVHVLEETGRKEETLVKTIVIITHPNPVEEYFNLVVEFFEFPEETHPRLGCVRASKTMSIGNLSSILINDLTWKGLGICKDGIIMAQDTLVGESGFVNFDRVQVVQTSMRPMQFCQLPRSGVDITYSLDMETSSSVQAVKEILLTEFGKEISIHKSHPDQVVQLSFRYKLLNDNACIGIVLGGSKESFRIHLATSDAISIVLKYKDLTGKRRDAKYKYKHILMQPDGSTAELRAELSRHMHVDARAVKLTVNDKRVDEHDNLQQNNTLANGCIVSAGIKKRKTLRVKHPDNETEVAVELYMLEPVHLLKRYIAEKLNIDVLHMTLKCRNIEMNDIDLLQNYPLKNNMAMSLQLYRNRIVIHVLIPFKKIITSIVIDDTSKTTVDELLRYCAHKYQYRRVCSRSIYRNRCLDKKQTLAEEGLESGGDVVIVYFDHSYIPRGDLIRIFTVHPDGQITMRLGSVSSGCLLHASKKVPLQSSDDNELNNGHVPNGIYVSGNPVKRRNISKKTPSLEEKDNIEKTLEKLNPQERTRLKSKYLRRAKRVIRKMFEKQIIPTDASDIADQTFVKQVFNNKSIEKDGSGCAANGTPVFFLPHDAVDGSEKNSLSEQTGNIESCMLEVPETHVQTRNSDQNGKQFSYEGQKCSCGRESFARTEYNRSAQNKKKEPLTFAQNNNDTTVHTSTKINATPFNENAGDMEKETLIRLCCLDDNVSIQTIKSGHTSLGEELYIAIRSVDKADESDTSDSNTHQDVEVIERGHAYQHDHTYVCLICHPTCLQPRRRSHTLGDLHCNRCIRIPHNQTVPLLYQEQFISNADLTTAGITIQLLQLVSSKMSKDWKQLARKLGLAEYQIESIEHEYRQLCEQSYQALVVWKRSNGINASKAKLLQALNEIGMASVAESCELVGYVTA